MPCSASQPELVCHVVLLTFLFTCFLLQATDDKLGEQGVLQQQQHTHHHHQQGGGASSTNVTSATTRSLSSISPPLSSSTTSGGATATTTPTSIGNTSYTMQDNEVGGGQPPQHHLQREEAIAINTVNTSHQHHGQSHQHHAVPQPTNRADPQHHRYNPSNYPAAVKLLVSNNVAGSIIGRAGQTISELQQQSMTRIKLSQAGDYYPGTRGQGTQDRVCMVQGDVQPVKVALRLLLERLYRLQQQQHTQYSQSKQWQQRERDRQQESKGESGSSGTGDSSGDASATGGKNASDSAASSGQPTATPPLFDFVVRLLVPSSSCGMIIGKSGSNIKFMEESTGVSSVRLSPKEQGSVNNNSLRSNPNINAAAADCMGGATLERVVTITSSGKGNNLENCLQCLYLILDGMVSHPDIFRYTNMTTSYRGTGGGNSVGAGANVATIAAVLPENHHNTIDNRTALATAAHGRLHQPVVGGSRHIVLSVPSPVPTSLSPRRSEHQQLWDEGRVGGVPVSSTSMAAPYHSAPASATTIGVGQQQEPPRRTSSSPDLPKFFLPGLPSGAVVSGAPADPQQYLAGYSPTHMNSSGATSPTPLNSFFPPPSPSSSQPQFLSSSKGYSQQLLQQQQQQQPSCTSGGDTESSASTASPHTQMSQSTSAPDLLAVKVEKQLVVGSDSATTSAVYRPVQQQQPHGAPSPESQPHFVAAGVTDPNINNNRLNQNSGSNNNNSIGASSFVPQAPSLLEPNTFHAQVLVPDSMIGLILGRGGRTLTELQMLSGTRIRISQRGEYLPGTRNRIVTIRGLTEQSVWQAQCLMSNRMTLPPPAVAPAASDTIFLQHPQQQQQQPYVLHHQTQNQQIPQQLHPSTEWLPMTPSPPSLVGVVGTGAYHPAPTVGASLSSSSAQQPSPGNYSLGGGSGNTKRQGLEDEET